MTLLSDDKIEKIARVMHESVRAWQVANGQAASPPWSRAAKWMRESSFAGVKFAVDNPNAPASAQHDQWMKEKRDSGWVFGEIKDPAAKTHPLLIPYQELPELERRKDALVHAVIVSLTKDL